MFRIHKKLQHSLTIFTVCCGREDYLPQLLKCLSENKRHYQRFVFVQNGYSASKNVRRLLKRARAEIVTFEKTIPIGHCIEAIKSGFDTTHVMKIDDDAIPIGADFFKHLSAIIELMPDIAFSPFPVGLINNRGGPEIRKDMALDIRHSQTTDTFYNFRPVWHIGGLCRIAPRSCYDLVAFTSEKHVEDMEFSRAMRENKIQMRYLENALVVEHAETSFGQNRRNAAYFESLRGGVKTPEANPPEPHQMPAKAAQQ